MMYKKHATFPDVAITSGKKLSTRRRNRKKTTRCHGCRCITHNFHYAWEHLIVSASYRLVFIALGTKLVWYWSLPVNSFVVALEESQIDIDSMHNVNENIMILTMAGILGICISLVGIIVCYFFLLEGMLMRAYYYDGIPIDGRIKNCTFFRASGRDSEAEYKAELDYRCKDTGGYSTVVHKQINILDSDLCNLREKENAAQKREPHNRIIIHVDLQNFEKEFHSDSSDLSSDKNILDMSVLLEVVLIPYHPNSGIPKFLVDRSFNVTSKLKTFAITGCLFLISVLSVFWGVTASQIDITTSSLSDFYLSILVTSGVWLVITIPVHCFLRKLLEKALIDEYLEGGDTLIKMDDETLATMSSGTASLFEGNIPDQIEDE